MVAASVETGPLMATDVELVGGPWDGHEMTTTVPFVLLPDRVRTDPRDPVAVHSYAFTDGDRTRMHYLGAERY